MAEWLNAGSLTVEWLLCWQINSTGGCFGLSLCYIPMLWDWPSYSPLSVSHMLPFFSAHRLKVSLCSEQLDYTLKFEHLFPNDMTSAGVLRMVAESTAQHSVLAVGYYRHAFHQNILLIRREVFKSRIKVVSTSERLAVTVVLQKQPSDCFIAGRLLTCRWDGSCRLVCERSISKVDDQNLLWGVFW